MSAELKILLYFMGSALISAVTAPFFVALLGKLKARQTVLGYVTQHEHKSGTPTMGGIIFLLPLLISALCESTSFSLVSASVIFGFGVLGFLDDFIKIRFSRNLGLKPYQKIIGQLGLSAIAAYFCYASPYAGSQINVPFGAPAELSYGIIPFVILIFVATTNSVNLTDGLDGLAATVSAGYFAVFATVTYLAYTDATGAGDARAANEILSLTAICASAAGGLSGYLIFNSNPATVMMGDTGSLALGAAVACVAVFSRNPFLLPVAGIMFVWSSISVIMQVLVFKATKKRIFLMAPFHHHLEMKGLSEAKICALYFFVTAVAGAITLIFARTI